MVSKIFIGSGEKKRDGHYPIRTCIGCRKKEKSPLLVSMHCIKDPDNGKAEIIFNARRTGGVKVSGRGAWLHYDSVCFTKAIKRDAFFASFKARERKINFCRPAIEDFETIMTEEAGRKRMLAR